MHVLSPRRLTVCGLVGSAMLLVRVAAFAQATTLGKYPFLVLQLPASARMLALGDATVAGRDDDVLFADPAQLATARGTSASYEHFGASADGGALSSVIRIGSGGVAVGMSTVNFKPAGVYPLDRSGMLDTGSATGSSSVAAIGLAQTFKRFHVGVTGKYVEDQIGPGGGHFDRILGDAGVSRDVNWFNTNATAALAVQNFGSTLNTPTTTNLPPPLRTTLGVSAGAPVGQLDLAGAAQVAVRRDGWVKPAGGLELGFSWIEGFSVAVRAGARRPEPGEAALTAGAGFNGDRVSIDYALETLSGSRIAHRIGLRVR